MGKEDVIVVAFRGTEPNKIKDWFTDLEIPLTDSPVGMVHKGFYTRLLAIWTQLNNALTTLQHAGKSIWITGHSLGAALAALAAAKLLKEGVVASTNGLYTYGQPRTGNPQFAEWFDSMMKPRIFRHVNNKDIVTNVPLPPLYKHAGTLEFYNSDGKRQTDIRFWTRFKELVAEDTENLIQGRLVPEALKDHFMDNYIFLLKNNL